MACLRSYFQSVGVTQSLGAVLHSNVGCSIVHCRHADQLLKNDRLFICLSIGIPPKNGIDPRLGRGRNETYLLVWFVWGHYAMTYARIHVSTWWHGHSPPCHGSYTSEPTRRYCAYVTAAGGFRTCGRSRTTTVDGGSRHG